MKQTLSAIAMTMSLLSNLAAGDSHSAKIDELLREFNQPGKPGASVMVIRDGKVLFAKGYGLARVEEKVPCDTNTNFRLASVSKQFTAMAVMQLVERGKLSLDEKLTGIFPEFPAYGKEMTVRHLLTHTSGLRDYEDVIPKGTTIPVLDRDVLRLMLRQTTTDFPPGSKYRYSNTGYALLALIVEARSGQTFAAFLRDNIFQPLGMVGTLAYEEGSSLVPNRAYGYTVVPDGAQPSDQSLTSSVLGDGGIYSSVTDLFKWDQALYSSKLVSQKTLEAVFTPRVKTDKPDTHYGYGWYLGEHRGVKKIFHTGETCGFTTRFERFPEKKLSLIILTNRRDVANELKEIALQLADMFWEPK